MRRNQHKRHRVEGKGKIKKVRADEQLQRVSRRKNEGRWAQESPWGAPPVPGTLTVPKKEPLRPQIQVSPRNPGGGQTRSESRGQNLLSRSEKVQKGSVFSEPKGGRERCLSGNTPKHATATVVAARQRRGGRKKNLRASSVGGPPGKQ